MCSRSSCRRRRARRTSTWCRRSARGSSASARSGTTVPCPRAPCARRGSQARHGRGPRPLRCRRRPPGWHWPPGAPRVAPSLARRRPQRPRRTAPPVPGGRVPGGGCLGGGCLGGGCLGGGCRGAGAWGAGAWGAGTCGAAAVVAAVTPGSTGRRHEKQSRSRSPRRASQCGHVRVAISLPRGRCTVARAPERIPGGSTARAPPPSTKIDARTRPAMSHSGAVAAPSAPAPACRSSEPRGQRRHEHVGTFPRRLLRYDRSASHRTAPDERARLPRTSNGVTSRCEVTCAHGALSTPVSLPFPVGTGCHWA